jgi:Spy/CpxP family protein refolding chaperone
MRSRFLVAFGFGLLLAGCSGDTAAPNEQDGLSLVPEFAQSMASAVDPAGIGGAMLPPELALTAEQKAAIVALHEAFRTATAADVAALRALEAEARAARTAGKSREEIHAILARGLPLLAHLTEAFTALQAAVWQIYTPEQRAWIEEHRPRPCGPEGPPKLTDAQIQQIRALQEAFVTAVATDIAFIRHTVEAAHQAAQSGASRAEVEAILHQADAARARVREAELRLHAAIDAVLTPEQRAARCVPGPHRP